MENLEKRVTKSDARKNKNEEIVDQGAGAQRIEKAKTKICRVRKETENKMTEL